MLVFGCLNMKLSKVAFFGAASEVVLFFKLPFNGVLLQQQKTRQSSDTVYFTVSNFFTEIYPKQTSNKNRLFILIPVLYRRKSSYCITVIFLFGTFKHYPQVTSFSWSCLLQSSGYRRHEIDGLAKIFCKALVATSSWDTCDRMDGACTPP